MKEGLGDLVDELSILNQKIWVTQDIVATEKDDSKVANAARKAVKLNQQRNKIIRILNTIKLTLNEEVDESEKVYREIENA